MSSLGKAIPHDSAVGHVTGTADFIEDMPRRHRELQVGFLGSPVAAGRLRSINVEAAKTVDGVVALYTHCDIGGHNHFGPIFEDEPFLVADEIAYVGQPIVVIAAESAEAIEQAKAAIELDVQQAEPILHIEDAIAAGSYLGPTRKIARGDLEAGFAASDHIIEGTFRNNGQEQFYLESQACLAELGEMRSLTLHCSTQNPTETQAVVAEVLGLSMHQVVCQCKRMGGGFGGKETQSAIPALMTSLVALKTQRPARIVYDKHTDMIVTGKRHAYVSRYRVGFDAQGRIIAAKFDFFSNGGAFADLSTSVMERTMLHADNAYHLPAVSITGQVCRTNLPPNTAFRGFGGPQGVVVIENVMQEIAARIDSDAVDVRRVNLYRDGDATANTTPYGQIVRDHVLPELFESVRRNSVYDERREAINRFNASSPSHVKGLALSMIKFGISFTSKFLNQGNALVNVYIDGTIQVSTGGTEMGQGLNTKIRQLVASEFGIPVDDVVLMTTSTEKNNNTSPTAASAGTDLNGSAAVIACEQIKKRMADFAATHFGTTRSLTAADIEFDDGYVRVRDSQMCQPSEEVSENELPETAMRFGDFCALARRERIDLGQRSFYATPGVDFDRETGQGTPFHYFTTGAAVAEVTIDRWTGEMVVDQIDLMMDIGEMINPGIDRGQVIGGFVQGMGWCTTEELVYDASGALLSTGPTTYKIPDITDVPKHFHVSFIDNPKHKINVRRSKAVGEPPLMLGTSVWMAAKDAMLSLASTPSAQQAATELALPATGEVLLRCMTRMRVDHDSVPDEVDRFQMS
ncbi:MAG: xanthine dehydrogenase molybdopterin binding subunit [Planctomycetota bacterium]